MDSGLKSSQSPVTRDIFLEALDLAPSARRAFLDNVCGGDSTLRQRIEELLAEHENLSHDFLDQPAAKPTLPDQSNFAKPGDQIGRYRLLQQIGEGGAGVVFMAEQSEPVRRRVALKVLKLGMDTHQVVARFEAERQALAMMDHPNIAAVFDGGATEAGRPFFVMELVRGTPITAYCDQHNLPVETRLKLFAQVCHAIQHAHQKGVIHRDIKPSNILVTESEGGALPKVIDFGIAKAIEQPLTEKTLFTEFHSLIGTPAYMSPEQLDMAGADVDTRSDIYSLGVLLYEMLTGQTPFAAKTLVQSGVDEFRRAVREVEPERPSSRVTRYAETDLTTTATQRQLDDRSLLRLLRGELDWIAIKCLEKDRARRYATVNDLTADIQRFLTGEPVLARAPTTTYRVQKFLHRHQIAVSAAVVVLVALVTASIISLKQAATARHAERLANESKLLAEAESARAQQSEARALLNEYVADVTLAQQSLAAGNFGRANSLLAKHTPTAGKPDLRGFEWGYLTHLSKGDPHDVLIESGDSVRSVAYSPDGKYIAVGARERAVVLNATNHSHYYVSTGGVFSVAFAADSSRLFLADPNSIRVVDLHNRTEDLLVTGVGAPIAISPDGKFLAAGSREAARLFQIEPWSSKRTLLRASGPLAFSRDGKTLLTASRDGFLLWPLNSDDPALEVATSQARGGFFHQFLRTLAFSADNSRFFAARDKLIYVYDAKTSGQIATIPRDGEPVHNSAIAAAALSPDGKILATASWDHSIQLWDAENYTHIRSLKGHLNEVWSITFSPDGKNLLSGAKDGGVFVWPLESRARADLLLADWQPIAFSEDEKSLAAFNRRTGAINLISVETGATQELPNLLSLPQPRAGSQSPFRSSASANADLNVIARSLSERSVEVFNRSANSKITIPVDDPVVNTALNSRGTAIAISFWGRGVEYHDLQSTNDPPISFRADRALFTTDSQRLLLIDREGLVTVWNCLMRANERTFNLEIPPGFSYAISPDNRILAASAMPDLSNTILLVDITTGKSIGTLFGHKQGVGSLAFSPDGRTLASASGEGALKLWNIPTLQEILTFPVQANQVVFSPRGHYLAFHARNTNPEGAQILRATFPDR